MLCLSSSRPRLSRKTSLPWRSPSNIESRTFDMTAKSPTALPSERESGFGRFRYRSCARGAGLSHAAIAGET